MTRNKNTQSRRSTSRIAPESDNAPYQLLCLVEDEWTLFKITPPPNIDILDLKTLIHKERKNGALRGVDAADLVLLNVSTA
jgi:hypothetical protein